MDSTQQDLIADIARDAVAQLSPRELPLFRASSQAFFKDPDAIQVGGKDEMIGFGVGEVAGMLTPVVLAVTLEVVRSVAEQVKETIKEEGGSLSVEWIKLVFKKYRPAQKDEKEPAAEDAGGASQPAKPVPAPPPPLTPQQLAAVRKVALKKARQLRLSDANAMILADAIIGGLAVA